MSTFVATVSRSITSIAGCFNRARLGYPRYYFQGTGGIGDDLMATAVFHELRVRGASGIAATTQYPELYSGNPDVDIVIPACGHPRLDRWLRRGLPFVRLGYAHYDSDSDRDEPLSEHILAKICRLAGLTGSISLRPYLYLTDAEMAAGRHGAAQIAIQSSGLAAAHSMLNKEWGPERFQEVCSKLCGQNTVVQIGSSKDPVLTGALDLRGRTSLRQSAAILANSDVFIGQVGFLMHLARAVECRSVIVYGGRERPWQSGYVANENLVGETACSPCWFRNRCAFGHACMDMITPPMVLAGVHKLLAENGSPLAVETTVL